jgi:uncharacterized membrane protein
LTTGINIAKPEAGEALTQQDSDNWEYKAMKELANTFAQLAAIIMILVTLAVSTAALSQWGGVDGSSSSAQTLQLSYGGR